MLFLNWIIISIFTLITLTLIILIRITTPRLRLETLTRLGWLTLLSQIGIVILIYLCGFLLG